ncbi:hypothetical protein BV898_05791 [Hypsibius exemplaris]|uniref:Uncharacterized protein n=1 Tax=Hypsibius exemplaris TaxID=2072580 RepID=A0A1W0WYF7_HYPEX|nr:hypothetical protein BV898_05791 [Hypsibius exemplaris]
MNLWEVIITSWFVWKRVGTQEAGAGVDVGIRPEDMIFPVESDSSSNHSIVRLPRLFPSGTNFTVTSLDFLSPTAGKSQPDDALYLDNLLGVFRAQESLRKYLGGVFRLRVTIISSETGIQTAEEIRIPVVDKTYRLKLVFSKKPELTTASKAELFAQLRSTITIKGKNLEFIPERSELQSGKAEVDRFDLCFYVIQPPGFPISALDSLPLLQRNQTDLMLFFLGKYHVQRFTYCHSDLAAAASGPRMDGLSIGLLTLAVALSIFLVGAVIFVCCWIRMKKLHAAVLAAHQPTSQQTSPLEQLAANQFTPSKKLPPGFQQFQAPLSVSQWSAMSLPTFSFGMLQHPNSGMLPPKQFRPPSSCDANYEWQESSLDLAGDGESINRSINDAFHNRTTSSSSAQSLTEDSVSVRRCDVHVDVVEEARISPVNTQL